MTSTVPLLLVLLLRLIPLHLLGPSCCAKGLPLVLHSCVGTPSAIETLHRDGERHDMSLACLEVCSPLQMGEGGSRTIEVSGKHISTDAEIKEMLVGFQVLIWCPFSCSPPCCPFARVSVKECPLQVCKSGDQRCLLGPFVFSSWDLMA